MFPKTGYLTEALVTRDEFSVTIVRVVTFNTEGAAADYHATQLLRIETEFKAQGLSYEHAQVEVDDVPQS